MLQIAVAYHIMKQDCVKPNVSCVLDELVAMMRRVAFNKAAFKVLLNYNMNYNLLVERDDKMYV